MLQAGQNKKTRILLTLAGDLVLVAVAYVLAFYLRATVPLPLVQDIMPFERFYQVRHYWLVLFGSQAAVLYFFGLYDPIHRGQKREMLVQIPVALFIQFLSLVAFYFFKGYAGTPLPAGSAPEALQYPRSVFVSFYLLNCLLIYAWRALLVKAFARTGYKRVILFGVGKTAREFIRNVDANPYFGLKIVGLVNEHPGNAQNGPLRAPADFEGYPVLGDRENLVQIIERERVDAVIMTPETSWQDELIDAVGRSDLTKANIFVVPSIFEMLISKMQHLQIEDIPLVEVVRNPTTGARFYVKRLVDIFLSIALVLLLSPVFLIAALAVLASGAGPVIYKQQRVGKDGALFTVYKFRTMIVDAEATTGAVLAREDDARVTPTGRWLRRLRLDETPQLFNILEGNMSFVGPRPERPEFVKNFSEQIPGYRERFKMKPGISGLAQVHGEYHTSPEMKLRYDLAYIYNHNLMLDLLIMMKTIRIMLTRRGI